MEYCEHDERDELANDEGMSLTCNKDSVIASPRRNCNGKRRAKLSQRLPQRNDHLNTSAERNSSAERKKTSCAVRWCDRVEDPSRRNIAWEFCGNLNF